MQIVSWEQRIKLTIGMAIVREVYGAAAAAAGTHYCMLKGPHEYTHIKINDEWLWAEMPHVLYTKYFF